MSASLKKSPTANALSHFLGRAGFPVSSFILGVTKWVGGKLSAPAMSLLNV